MTFFATNTFVYFTLAEMLLALAYCSNMHGYK